jgi:hypothetical protein
MTLEKRGIPTALFCPESFRGIIEAEARRCGLPSFQPVTVQGHVVALSPEDAVANIDRTAPGIIRWLARRK